MTFEDLTEWDLDLIRSHGIHAMGFTRVNDRYEALADCTLSCLHAKGFNVVPRSKNLVKEIAKAIPPKPAYNSITKEPTIREIIKEVFTYLRVNNIQIIKDEKREPTWSTPKESWYLNTGVTKKPWMF